MIRMENSRGRKTTQLICDKCKKIVQWERFVSLEEIKENERGRWIIKERIQVCKECVKEAKRIAELAEGEKI